MSPHVQSAIVRAVRTFVAAFLAIYPASAVLGALSGSQPLDTSALRAAAVAGIAAVISFFWRAILDRFNIPTLADKNPVPPPSA